MKAFLAITIALFALTAQAFNITAYNLGFVEKLGLDESAVEDASLCNTAITEAFSSVYDLVGATKEGHEEFVVSLFKVIQVFKSETLKTACEKYQVDVMQYFTQNVNITDIKQLIHHNYELYQTNIIQLVTKWLFHVTDELNSYDAGQDEAQILQILTGLEIPAQISYNVTNNTSTETDPATAFAKGFLGFHNIDNETQSVTLGKCFAAFNNAGQAISDFSSNYAMLDIDSAKVDLLKKTVYLGMEFVETCVFDAGHIFKKVYHFDMLKNYPLQTVYLLALDFALKLPQIEATYISMVGDLILKGNFEGAGWLLAQDAQLITDFFYEY